MLNVDAIDCLRSPTVARALMATCRCCCCSCPLAVMVAEAPSAVVVLLVVVVVDDEDGRITTVISIMVG